MKQHWKPGNMVYPLPAVMVSCGGTEEEYNLLTISWTGTLCTNPPLCYISVRPERHSYPILKKEGEFVINLTSVDMAYATDWCGVKSGKDFSKFKEMRLTPGKSLKIKAPTIEEAPINIECKVIDIKPLGSHDMFIAEVVNIQADERFIDKVTGAFDMQKANLLVYAHGKYYEMGNLIGSFGWSVKKKKKK